jgi:hypothetical protein
MPYVPTVSTPRPKFKDPTATEAPEERKRSFGEESPASCTPLAFYNGSVDGDGHRLPDDELTETKSPKQKITE